MQWLNLLGKVSMSLLTTLDTHNHNILQIDTLVKALCFNFEYLFICLWWCCYGKYFSLLLMWDCSEETDANHHNIRSTPVFQAFMGCTGFIIDQQPSELSIQ